MTGRPASFDDTARAYRPLVRSLARDFFAPGLEHQDMLQEGMVALWKAHRNFDPAGGASFGNFAALVIRRHLSTVVKAALRGKHVALNTAYSLDAPVPDQKDGAGTLAEVVPDHLASVHDIAEAREQVQHLAARTARLTATERDGLAARLNGTMGHRKDLDNASQRAIAKLRKPDAPHPLHGVLLVDRTIHPTEDAARQEAQRVRPGCTVHRVARKKVRRGVVTSTRGRRGSDGVLGRPVWAITLAA